MHRKFEIQFATSLAGVAACFGAYWIWRKPHALTVVFGLLFLATTALGIWKLRRTSDARFVDEERRGREWEARHPKLVKWSMILGCAVLIYDLWNACLR